MRLVSFAFAAAVAVSGTVAANATISPSLGGNRTDQLTLGAGGLTDGSGATVATLTGGSIYTTDEPFADIPKGGLYGGTFLASGLLAGQPSSLSFVQPTAYLSFLWGSPDTFNQLTVNTNLGSYLYTPTSLSFAQADGNQAFSQYVQFATSAGELIRSVSFTNVPGNNAFEVANFSVTQVPELATWAMMVAGFGLVGASARRQRLAAPIRLG